LKIRLSYIGKAVTGYWLQVAGYRLQITGFRLQVTGFKGMQALVFPVT
jgi:hypothetical protein